MTLEDYRLLPYHRNSEMIQEEDGSSSYWSAWIEEIPECKAYGDTLNDAMLSLDSAFDDYILAMIDFGSEIPKPQVALKKKAVSEALVVHGQSQYKPVFSECFPEPMVVESMHFRGRPKKTEVHPRPEIKEPNPFGVVPA